MVYDLVVGACGIQESDVKGKAANSVALSYAIICKLQNPI